VNISFSIGSVAFFRRRVGGGSVNGKPKQVVFGDHWRRELTFGVRRPKTVGPAPRNYGNARLLELLVHVNSGGIREGNFQHERIPLFECDVGHQPVGVSE